MQTPEQMRATEAAFEKVRSSDTRQGRRADLKVVESGPKIQLVPFDQIKLSSSALTGAMAALTTMASNAAPVTASLLNATTFAPSALPVGGFTTQQKLSLMNEILQPSMSISRRLEERNRRRNRVPLNSRAGAATMTTRRPRSRQTLSVRTVAKIVTLPGVRPYN